MALYELRTYTLHVSKMAEAVKLYREIGFPALQKGGQDKKLVGYFQSDTGTINQLVDLWKFDDDADRRALGSRVCEQGFRRRLRLEVPTVGNDPGSKTPPGSTVGIAPLSQHANLIRSQFHFTRSRQATSCCWIMPFPKSVTRP
jgi:hypothetical protein